MAGTLRPPLPGRFESIFLLTVWIEDKPEGPAVHNNQIPMAELSAAAGFLFPVHLDLTTLDTDLRLQAILDQIGQFEELTKPDRAGGDENVLNVLFHGLAMPVGCRG